MEINLPETDNTNPAKYKPLYFQVSRFSDLFNHIQSKVLAPNGLAFYRSGDPKILTAEFSQFMEKNGRYPGPLVIAVQTQGEKLIDDTLLVPGGIGMLPDAFEWTPVTLLYGLPINILIGKETIFPGLIQLLKPFKNKIYIVLDGGHASLIEEFKDVIKDRFIEVVGVSQKNSRDLPPAAMCLEDWLQSTFGDSVESPISAFPGSPEHMVRPRSKLLFYQFN